MRPDQTKIAGYSGEGLAFGYLLAFGYAVLARNWRIRAGEIDLVCEQAGTIVFVEVKTRRQGRFGAGAEAVDARKQRQIMGLARHYLQAHPGRACRFDVVEVDLMGSRPRIRHLIAAFP